MLRQASRITSTLASRARAVKTTTRANASVGSTSNALKAARAADLQRGVAGAAFSTLSPSSAALVRTQAPQSQPFAQVQRSNQPLLRAQQMRTNSSLSRDAIRQTEQFNHGLKTILALLSERGSWNYAEAWVPHESSQVMNCKATWADDTFTAVKDFREAAMSIQSIVRVKLARRKIERHKQSIKEEAERASGLRSHRSARRP